MLPHGATRSRRKSHPSRDAWIEIMLGKVMDAITSVASLTGCVDRNFCPSFPRPCMEVASLTGCVDRNEVDKGTFGQQLQVASLTGCVDRNYARGYTDVPINRSHPSRDAWIEMADPCVKVRNRHGRIPHGMRG